MSRLLLVGRLVARDLRNRPGQAVLMLLAITPPGGRGPAGRDGLTALI